jgi:hypothetical protein
VAEAQYKDDPSVKNDCRLFRRVPPTWIIWDGNLGRWRPTSAAFNNSRDGHPMSIALECELVLRGLPPSSVLAAHEGFSLTFITTELARNLGQAVVRDPTPDEPAHGLVVGTKSDKVKKRMAAAAVWEVAPDRPAPAHP